LPISAAAASYDISCIIFFDVITEGIATGSAMADTGFFTVTEISSL